MWCLTTREFKSHPERTLIRPEWGGWDYTHGKRLILPLLMIWFNILRLFLVTNSEFILLYNQITSIGIHSFILEPNLTRFLS